MLFIPYSLSLVLHHRKGRCFHAASSVAASLGCLKKLSRSCSRSLRDRSWRPSPARDWKGSVRHTPVGFGSASTHSAGSVERADHSTETGAGANSHGERAGWGVRSETSFLGCVFGPVWHTHHGHRRGSPRHNHQQHRSASRPSVQVVSFSCLQEGNGVSYLTQVGDI